MRNKFNEFLIEVMKRDDEVAMGMASTFDCKFIEVEHADGSKYHITHSRLEKTSINMLPCLVLFAEHNTPVLFVEYDLKKVVLQPYKGKKTVYKLEKEPTEASAMGLLKKALKKSGKKKSVKKATKKKK